MEKVWMYSTALCPYCVRARRLLEHKGVAFEEVRVDLEPQRRAEIYHRTGRRTVPQVFIGDRHIGDCEEIYALEAQGKLDALLKPAT
jgi:glutaredoxin 3